MDNYEKLANAVILQAVDDYRRTDDDLVLDEIESFFASGWFRTLTGLNPDILIDRLRKEKKRRDN